MITAPPGGRPGRTVPPPERTPSDVAASWDDLTGTLARALRAARSGPAGRPTRDVPALASAPVDGLGVAMADLDGAVHGAGDRQRPFSLQSVAKVFALVLLLSHEGDAAWAGLSMPGNEDHRSTSALDPPGSQGPGPFTNAGALVVVDRLMRHHDDVAQAVRALVVAQSGDGGTVVDEAVAASELAVCHRNRALVHLLAEHHLLERPVEDVLVQYVRVCALTATCTGAARAGLLLARHGRGRDGRDVVTAAHARQVNALMLTSGAYADSGRYALQVGLPLKTGIGGGLLAVVPGTGAVCAWSPGLDDRGTPVRALAAVSHLAAALGLSVF